MKLIVREPVEPEPRKAFTPTQKTAILAKSHGRCAVDGCGVTHGLEFDHIIPRALGGAHSVANAQATCPTHHKLKTRADRKRIAKANHQREKLVGLKESRHPLRSRKTVWPKGRKLQGRGFDGRRG